MPIWPTTTPEKAELFNKYGRGIVHMGLHIGVERFVYDKGGRRRRRKAVIRINALELNMLLDNIEAAIDLMPVKMVARTVVGQFNSPVYSFNGTGDDWQLLTYMIIEGDFGPVVMVDVKTRIEPVLGTARYQFAIAIDGVIDKTSAIRYQNASGTNARDPEIKTVLYPGPGQHKFQLACVVESVTTARLTLRMTVMRLMGLLETERD